MTILVFDIETNAIAIERVTKLHTGAYAQDEDFSATACDGELLIKRFQESTSLVGHNIIRYDLPCLKKLELLEDYYIDGFSAKNVKGEILFHVADTLLLSRLLAPEVKEHGLEVWGEKLGVIKPKVTNWVNQPIEVYQNRCKEDVKINNLVWAALKERAYTIEKAYKTEAHFADIISKQSRNGFRFDIKLAKKACAAIQKRMDELKEGTRGLLPQVSMNKGELKKVKIPVIKNTKDGKMYASAANFFVKHNCNYNVDTKLIEMADGSIIDPAKQEYLATTKDLQLSNQAGMKEYLFSLNWEPEYWNFKKDKLKKFIRIDGELVRSSPKVRSGEAICLSLVGLMGLSKDVKKVVRSYIAYSVYKHRLSALKGMLKQPRLRIDGKLSADMNTIGAATGRVTHKVVANIPKTINEFDDTRLVIDNVSNSKHIMRACFRASKGYILTGIDASAIEARVEAHFVYKYEGGIEYGKALLGTKPNDIHTINSKKLLISRDLAKAVKYALGYGAQVKKLMSLLRCSEDTAKRVFERYWISAACVKMLMQDLEQQWLNNDSRIKAIDGRPLFVDSKHKLLNYMFQSTGTIIMKNAACIMDKRLRKEGLYRFNAVRKVCDYHDEFQFESDRNVKGLARYVGEIGVESIREAGVVLGLNVPLDGEYKVGSHWGMTH